VVIVGIVLITLGVFAATYREDVSYPYSIPPGPVYVYPYASMVMILSLSGLAVLLLGFLLFLPIKIVWAKDSRK
jgi:hypothetical protein